MSALSVLLEDVESMQKSSPPSLVQLASMNLRVQTKLLGTKCELIATFDYKFCDRRLADCEEPIAL